MSPLPPFSPETLQWLRDNLYGTRRVVFTDELNATVDKFFRNVDTRIDNYVNARFQNFSSQIRGEVLSVLETNAEFQVLLNLHLLRVENILTNHESRLLRKSDEYALDAENKMKITRSQLVQSVLDMSSSGPLVQGIEQRVVEQVSPGPLFYSSIFMIGLAGGIIGSTIVSRMC